MTDFSILCAMFLNAFGAATILPMQSEALLVGLLLRTEIAPWLIVAVASAGNVCGSCVNWLLGRSIERFRGRRWFPVKGKVLDRAQAAYVKYGRPLLLLSWLPLIGDPVTVAAGLMREKFWIFVALVGISKTARYAGLAYVTLHLSS